jgi:hypothetical protein
MSVSQKYAITYHVQDNWTYLVSKFNLAKPSTLVLIAIHAFRQTLLLYNTNKVESKNGFEILHF